MARTVCFLLCLALLSPACARAPNRATVLRALVERTLLPEQAALVRDAGALTAAARALQEPGTGDLTVIRAAWKKALFTWERLYALRMGPLVDNSGLLRARFWPVRERSIEALLQQPGPITSSEVEALGVDLRGMYALEWLLFGEPSGRLVSGSAPEQERARSLVLKFAENAQSYADQAREKLADGQLLAEKLASVQHESVSRLVNQMITSVDALTNQRVGRVLDMQDHGSLQLHEVVGATSGVSSELVLAQLVATERIYLGTSNDGLAALVASVAPEIERSVRAHFERARQRVQDLGGPLERVVARDRPRVDAAFRALKELDLALKVELASALAVTLTFVAGDAD